MARQFHRISPASLYEKGAGFVVEERYDFTGDDELDWAIPAWDERGFPDLAETFPTVDAAEEAFRAYGLAVPARSANALICT